MIEKKGHGCLSGCFVWAMFGGMALMLTAVALRFEIWILMAFALLCLYIARQFTSKKQLRLPESSVHLRRYAFGAQVAGIEHAADGLQQRARGVRGQIVPAQQRLDRRVGRHLRFDQVTGGGQRNVHPDGGWGLGRPAARRSGRGNGHDEGQRPGANQHSVITYRPDSSPACAPEL